MPEKKYTYRLLSLLWIFLVIGISSFQTIIPITNDIAIEKNAKKELVIKQHSYEAVMPFFQLDFQQDFILEKSFFWQSNLVKISPIFCKQYIHLLLSYFFNLFTYTICINAP